MKNSITYVGMDTHKKDHKIAILYPGQEELVEMTILNQAREIGRLVKQIQRKSPGDIRFCYEAGVCGFTLQRRIESYGCQCAVIAPSLVPRKPGERIKTDRRDARKLALLFKNGLLTEVQPPNVEQEAARELTRQRETAMDNLGRIRQRVTKFLTRQGYIYTEGRAWTQKYITWLSGLRMEQSLLQEVYVHYLEELTYCGHRLDQLDQEVSRLAHSEPYRRIVGILRCHHGIDTLSAISLLTEIFDFGRFATPRELMSYLGLTPSESSSGEKQHKGGICKTGNRRVRRLLNEAAWHYRHPYKVGKHLRCRRIGQPAWAIALADKAGYRLSQRFSRLVHKGKLPCQVVIAVARELAGFIWAMLHTDAAHSSTAG
ncbi:MAG: IS110 family transposase [Anaerohalosphaeraceae bacterium]